MIIPGDKRKLTTIILSKMDEKKHDEKPKEIEVAPEADMRGEDSLDASVQDFFSAVDRRSVKDLKDSLRAIMHEINQE